MTKRYRTPLAPQRVPPRDGLVGELMIVLLIETKSPKVKLLAGSHPNNRYLLRQDSTKHRRCDEIRYSSNQ